MMAAIGVPGVEEAKDRGASSEEIHEIIKAHLAQREQAR